MKRFLLRLHRRWIQRGLRFWYTRWGEKSFLVIAAVAVGTFTALLAALLHALVVRLEKFGFWVFYTPHDLHEFFWVVLFIVMPFLGLAASFLIQRAFGGPKYAKSLSPLILALNRTRTSIPVSEMFTHMISSALSVGLGGSAGLEAPSVLTGAAVGANTGSFCKLDRVKRMLLLGCGAAAAISAIFDSPVAGVLFAAEVLLPEFSVSALIPMIIASAVSSVISRMIVPEKQLFFAINAPWKADAIPCYFLCGAVCALVGVYIIRMAYYSSAKLKQHCRNPYQRLRVGGALLCLVLFCFPVLRGQGYLFIGKLFAGDVDGLAQYSALANYLSPGWNLAVLMLSVLVLKVVASVLTVDAGGDGGIFAPTMFVGAFTGFAFARLVNATGVISLQEYNFVAVGMCGVFTAVMHAPLTGIFLIAEVTGGYVLLVPLMIVSSVAFFVARKFEPHSIYRKALAESNLLGDDRDRSMLQRLTVRTALKSNYRALAIDSPIKTLVAMLEENPPDETFPVLDDQGKLLGVIYLEKVLSAVLNMEHYGHLLAFDLMETPPVELKPDDDLATAMAAFDRSGANELPVTEGGLFLGFAAKAPIFGQYRRMVREANSF